MAQIVTIAQQKGGAGKTTLAAQLAVAWAKGRRKVALMDIDPQGSLAAWYAQREAGGLADPEKLMVSAVAGWRISTEMDRLASRYDIVIVDTPPHAETEARAAIRAGHLLLIPVQPSPMDVWATAPTLELARKEKTPAMIVLNRVPPRGKLPETMVSKLQADGLPVARTRIGGRLAFAASMMDGQGVVETQGNSAAATEIKALAKEVADHLKRG